VIPPPVIPSAVTRLAVTRLAVTRLAVTRLAVTQPGAASPTWPSGELPGRPGSAALNVVKRSGILIAAGLLLALGGCGGHKPAAAPPATGSAPASGQPSGAASASPSASPSAVLVEFSVDGVGPYQIGASLTALKASPGVDAPTTGGQTCPDNTVAQGTGAWHDVQLHFRKDGNLFLLINKSTSIPTPSGAWVGTTLAQLKTIYASTQGENLTRATATAYLVTTQSGQAILFDLGPSQQVTDMIAGDGPYLKATFLSGAADYC
jgi:hypothetical protein